MSISEQLRRIEGKLGKQEESLSEIRQNQARDLERFRAVDRQFATAAEDGDKNLQLHAADCPAKQQLAELTNRAAGAWWAGGRLWAAVLAAAVAIDLALKLLKAASGQ